MQYEKTDPVVSFEEQLAADHSGPVVLVSLYSVPAEQMDALLKGWKDRSDMMRQQPGLISAQLHKGIGGASILVSYIVWESLAAYRTAQEKPDGHEDLAALNLVTRPVLIEKIAIPGLCVA